MIASGGLPGRWRWAVMVCAAAVVLGLVPAGAGSVAAVASASTEISGVDSQKVSGGIAKAADLSAFRPGQIISDAVFFNSGTMTEGQIQAFLEAKVPNCQAGYTCLKSKRDTSTDRAADAMCSGYRGAADEPASRIIARVAQACGINPQVILATLQKEQGLVTHTWPSEFRYRAAMGQGCPDTAECDARYYGFFNQVYGAAWQFKRYANPPGTSAYFTWYAPGRTWNVRYHPNVSCGAAPVYIENQATANLYYYTPYQPNRAALAAGYGTGDGCSSYGNRNFFNYFTDWFGSTTIATHGGIGAAWTAAGGATGWIGGPTAEMVWDEANGGGWYQRFANAWIYMKVGGPAVILKASSLLNATYSAGGGPKSRYGWPISGEECASAGCAVQFQAGTLVWSNQTGAIHPVVGSIEVLWRANGGVASALRAPESAERYVPDNGGGWTQKFLGGTVFIKAGGSSTWFWSGSGLLSRYNASGGTASDLGWPKTAESCVADVGCWAQFDGAILTWDAGTGTIARISGLFAQAWLGEGNRMNSIGPARSEMVSSNGGWKQDFRNGTYYLKAGGTLNALGASSALHSTYRARGGANGALGWPTSGESCGGAGCMASFEKGHLVWERASGAVVSTSGALESSWSETGGLTSWAGAPIAEPSRVVAAVPGWTQEFRNAYGYAKDGASAILHKRSSALAAMYRSAGGPTGSLGWPTAGEVCGSGECVLAFERGELVWSAATGTIARR